MLLCGALVPFDAEEGSVFLSEDILAFHAHWLLHVENNCSWIFVLYKILVISSDSAYVSLMLIKAPNFLIASTVHY